MDRDAMFRGADIPQSPLEEVLTVLRPIAARLDQEGVLLHPGEYDEVRRAIQTLAGILDATPAPETLAATLELVAGEERTKVERLAALTALADRLEEARPLTLCVQLVKYRIPAHAVDHPGLAAGRPADHAGRPRRYWENPYRRAGGQRSGRPVAADFHSH